MRGIGHLGLLQGARALKMPAWLQGTEPVQAQRVPVVIFTRSQSQLTFLCKVFVNDQLSMSQVIQHRPKIGGISVD